MTKEDIISIVCGACGIGPVDLQKRSRKEPLPTARALIAHYLYRELNMMPREIFPLIGCDRSSVYHYLGRSTLVEHRGPFQKHLLSIKELIDNELL